MNQTIKKATPQMIKIILSANAFMSNTKYKNILLTCKTSLSTRVKSSQCHSERSLAQ